MAIPQELISMTDYEFEGNNEEYETKEELERRRRNRAATKRAREKTNLKFQQKQAEYLREIEENTKLKYCVHKKMKQLQDLLISAEQHKAVCPTFNYHLIIKESLLTELLPETGKRPIYKTSEASHTTTVSAEEGCQTSINQLSATDYPPQKRCRTPSCNTEPVTAVTQASILVPVANINAIGLQTSYVSSVQRSNLEIQDQTGELTGSIQDTDVLNYSLPNVHTASSSSSQYLITQEQNILIPQSTTAEQIEISETCNQICNGTVTSHTEVTAPSDGVKQSQLQLLGETCTLSTKYTTVAQQGCESHIQTELYVVVDKSLSQTGLPSSLPLLSTTTSHGKTSQNEATTQPTAQLSIPDFEVLKPTQADEDQDHPPSKGTASKKTRQAKKKCKENSLDNDTPHSLDYIRAIEAIKAQLMSCEPNEMKNVLNVPV